MFNLTLLCSKCHFSPSYYPLLVSFIFLYRISYSLVSSAGRPVCPVSWSVIFSLARASLQSGLQSVSPRQCLSSSANLSQSQLCSDAKTKLPASEPHTSRGSRLYTQHKIRNFNILFYSEIINT